MSDKKTVRDRAQERKERRDAKSVVRPMAMPVAARPLGAPSTKIATVAPGLANGPINVPGGTVTSVYDRVPRLPCPVCGGLIAISLHDLISASAFNCPVCLTSMTMNRHASEEALRHVQHFYVASKDLKLG